VEDDLKQKFQPNFFFSIFSKKTKNIFFFSFEEVIGTYANIKIATLDFIFSY